MATSCSCSSSRRFLVVNGVPLTGDVPSVSSFLETTSGAYTTTRTHGNASLVLFWDRHLRRLADSARILADSRPDFFGPGRRRCRALPSLSAIQPLVLDSLRVGLGLALRERDSAGSTEELAITALIRSRGDEKDGLDAYLHIGFYAPPAFGGCGAHLAVAGRGRDIAAAKYSDWARIRKYMEKMRPPSATELLLSDDGDQILEGSVTNFFVVCRKVINGVSDESLYDHEREYKFEVQTAPISDGVLPGVIRQLVIEVCSSRGIPLREVAPSWSDCHLWEEAFVTRSGILDDILMPKNSVNPFIGTIYLCGDDSSIKADNYNLRLLQHVETIRVPSSYKELHMKTWKEVSWLGKRFEGAGLITTEIQREIIEGARAGGYQISK